jgi:hypothetical protein
MAQVIEVRKSGIGMAAVVLTVTGVDNEVTVALNGTEIARLIGPPGFTIYNENLTDKLIKGKPNVLVFTKVMQTKLHEQLTLSDAEVILLRLPERIRTALIDRAAEIEYPIEAVVEMAIASFLDTEALGFVDCKPGRGQ